jgi:hypothetical protein
MSLFVQQNGLGGVVRGDREEVGRGWIWEPGRGPAGGRKELTMYTSFFVQQNGLGGAVCGGRGDFRRGWIREPGTALAAGGKKPIMYTRLFVQQNGLGGAVCGGRGFLWSLIGRPGRAVAEREYR